MDGPPRADQAAEIKGACSRLRPSIAVHTMQGSNERTTCCTATDFAPSGPTTVPVSRLLKPPGNALEIARGEVPVVGAMIW